ncbi:MAG: DUF1295 domain-containing protein [Candidatus Coatesbacteria bacterium]|nr:DUF1295 domain-containing protein [Candidatus Coatesbacteria bacterium]
MLERLRSDRSLSLLYIGLAYLLAGAAARLTAGAAAELHPLWRLALADLTATLVVFVFSVVADNSSVYDPYWSLLPIAAVLWWTLEHPGADPLRRWLVVGLVALWGLRLTANWLRRWRGLGDEDWRYRDIRAFSARCYWPVSLGAIHLLPTVVVFTALVPLYPVLTSSRPCGILDAVAALVTLGAVVLETVADEQLRRHLADEDAAGLLTDGLWGWVRHPNYTGEVAFWWGLWLFVPAAAPTAWWWTLPGPLLMTALFVFVSVPLKDRRMLGRYPQYRQHRRRLPALFNLPRSG